MRTQEFSASTRRRRARAGVRLVLTAADLDAAGYQSLPGGVAYDGVGGQIEVLAYTTVDDVGNAIDRASVEGQVHGGVMQGVGQVLGEHAIHDHDTGQLLSGSFMDYPMPRADWMREIRCGEHPVPTQMNALGAKGVGESGTSGALPATMNAILCALRPAGVRELDMPATPHRVWRALSAAHPAAAAK